MGTGHAKGSERPRGQPSTAPPRPAVLLRFPWPRPRQTPGPINQHSPCHHHRKESCASGWRDWFPSHKGTFGSWRPTLLPGDQTIVLPRSSHHSWLFRGQRTESLCLCSQAGPFVASMQRGGRGRPGGGDRRLVLHKDALGYSLRIRATLYPPTCPDVSNLHRFFVNLLSSGSPEVCPRSLLQICKN